MVSEKECFNALEKLKKYVCYDNVDDLVCFKKLIHEHFDNPPLKFEEIEEGMWIWDNKEKFWIKALETVIVGETEYSEFYQDIYVDGVKALKIGYHDFNWKITVFEENRFYRKQVEE